MALVALVTAPAIIVTLVSRLVIIAVVLGVAVRAPRPNWRIIGVCGLAIVANIAQAFGLFIEAGVVGCLLWGLLAVVLIHKIQWDPETLRAKMLAIYEADIQERERRQTPPDGVPHRHET